MIFWLALTVRQKYSFISLAECSSFTKYCNIISSFYRNIGSQRWRRKGFRNKNFHVQFFGFLLQAFASRPLLSNEPSWLNCNVASETSKSSSSSRRSSFRSFWEANSYPEAWGRPHLKCKEMISILFFSQLFYKGIGF